MECWNSGMMKRREFGGQRSEVGNQRTENRGRTTQDSRLSILRSGATAEDGRRFDGRWDSWAR